MTVSNAVVCLLLVGAIWAILQALGAFAAGVNDFPAIVLLGLGIILTISSWPLAKSVSSRRKRFSGHAFNGVACLLYLVVLWCAGTMWLHVTRRLFLVPAGYQGELYVVHDSPEGKQARLGLKRTEYRFPADGVLRTTDPAPQAFSDEYKYIYPDGRLQNIKDAGPGTLQNTPENRANTKEVVTYFGRSSPRTASYACDVEEISIGTRPFLLADRSIHRDPSITHPEMCRGAK